MVVSIDANGLEGGQYNCLLAISDANATNSPQYVTVNLDVRTPLIKMTPTNFSLSCPVGGPNPATQNLSVWNDGIGILHWTISEDCNWLDVSPSFGQSSGEIDEVNLSIDATGLVEGL